MAVKTASIVLEGGDMRFVGRVGSGHEIVLDDGASDSGARPAELMALAVAGCTAMDVISILRKKRQEVTRYEVRASGTQMDEHPHAFTRVDVTHIVEGPGLDVEAVRRSIELSATRYCSVGSTLASGITEIHHGYVVRDGSGAEVAAEVLVMGPNADPIAARTGASAS
jgi:putative redox protein